MLFVAAASLALIGSGGAAAGASEVTVYIEAGQDIQATIGEYPAGTTFVLEAGVHRMQSVVPRDGDTFVGEPGAVMRGSKVLEDFERAGDLWVAWGQHQELKNTGLCRPWGPDERPIMCTHPEQLFIDGTPLTQVHARTAVDATTWYFDYEHDAIYFGADPSGRLVETSVTPTAFSGPAAGVTIRGLVIEQYANRAQVGAVQGSEGRNWTVEGNEIRFNHGYGIRTGPGMLVRGNRVHHQGQLGIGGSGDHVSVIGNEVGFNNQEGFAPGWEGGGTKFVNMSGLTVRGNWIHRNAGRGIWTDIDVIDAVIERNVVEWNTDAGIVHEISYSAVIRGNVARFNGIARDEWLWGAQILVQNASDVLVTHNLAVVHQDGGDGIGIINQQRGDGRHGSRVSADVTVEHNLVVYLGSVGDSGAVDDSLRPEYVCGDEAGNTFDHNTYYLGYASSRMWDWCGARTWSEVQAMGTEVHGHLEVGNTAGIGVVGSACCSEIDWPLLLSVRHRAPGTASLQGSLGAGVLASIEAVE